VGGERWVIEASLAWRGRGAAALLEIAYVELGDEVRLGGTSVVTSPVQGGALVRAPAGGRLRKNGLSCVATETTLGPNDAIQIANERLVLGLRLVDDDQERFAPSLAARAAESALGPTGLSLVMHAVAIGALLLGDAPPVDDAELDAERLEMMRAYAVSAGAAAGWDEGGGSVDADELPVAEESAGSPGRSAPRVTARPVDIVERERVPSREKLLDEARAFGMISLLAVAQVPEGVPGKRGIWSDSSALASSAGGAGTDGELGDIGGLGLSGVGEGSGGRGEGINIGMIGKIGHGAGGPSGDSFGFGCGCGHGLPGGSHTTRAPIIRCGSAENPSVGCTTQVNGRLPSEIIQRIVRQNHGRMRLCYENGLRDNPSLAGRVAIKFVIGRDGGVTTSAVGESDLGNLSVERCVARSFEELTFPQPEGGIVTVVYPLVFSLEG
jgi:hypothetical protein